MRGKEKKDRRRSKRKKRQTRAQPGEKESGAEAPRGTEGQYGLAYYLRATSLSHREARVREQSRLNFKSPARIIPPPCSGHSARLTSLKREMPGNSPVRSNAPPIPPSIVFPRGTLGHVHEPLGHVTLRKKVARSFRV